MAKGQMRSNKEKKKPKQDKNKKKGGASNSLAVRRHAQPIQSRRQSLRQEVLDRPQPRLAPLKSAPVQSCPDLTPYRVMTSAIFLSDGFTISNLCCSIAKSYVFSAGTSLAALPGTGAIFTPLGTTAPAVASKPDGAF